MNRYDAVATLGWALLALGWMFRRDRSRHLACVLPGMAIDLGLVLWLEFTRSVIERTMGSAAVPDPRAYGVAERIHIGTSTAAVVLYLPTIWLGVKLAWGRAGLRTPLVRTWHRRCAVSALVLRTVGFAFMWTV